MKTRYAIFITVAVLVIIALYLIPIPFSPIQPLVVSTFKQSVLEEFESLDEVRLFQEKYDVTRTGESFNAFQSQYAKFYFIEPNGIIKPPMMNMVVIKDLISGEIYMHGACFPIVASEGYRLEQRQILPFLQEHDCLKDRQITQKILDEKFPPFSIVHRMSDEIFATDRVVDVLIPKGISDYEKLDLEPSVVTVVIGKNNTVRWTNHDESPSTLFNEDQAWTTGIIEPGKSAVLTFNDPGVYEYHGYYHPWKTGTIIVLEE